MLIKRVSSHLEKCKNLYVRKIRNALQKCANYKGPRTLLNSTFAPRTHPFAEGFVTSFHRQSQPLFFRTIIRTCPQVGKIINLNNLTGLFQVRERSLTDRSRIIVIVATRASYCVRISRINRRVIVTTSLFVYFIVAY